jgi:hypothetical protein
MFIWVGLALPADYVIKTGDMIRITIFPPAVVPMLMAPAPLMGTSADMTVMKMTSARG